MAELEKFEGDLFWDAADTEQSVYDPEDALEEYDPLQVVEFQQAKVLPNFYGFWVRKDEGDDEFRFFPTREEAEAAIQEHKAKA